MVPLPAWGLGAGGSNSCFDARRRSAVAMNGVPQMVDILPKGT